MLRLIALLLLSCSLIACDSAARGSGSEDGGGDDGTDAFDVGSASGHLDGGASGDVALDATGDAGVDAAADAGVDAAADAGVDAAADAAGEAPRILIHIRAEASDFAHADGFSGQTPAAHVNGIRSFHLLQGRDDAAPQLVFDHGMSFVEASYDDGADTVVGVAPHADLEPGHYDYGRVVLSHLRYQVDATMHANGLHFAGVFDNVQVLSDGTELDGEVRERGWFRYVFEAAGQRFPREGVGGVPIPTAPAGAPIETVLEDGQLALYFPVDIDLAADVPADVHQVIEFNVHESFRWEDEDGDRYEEGIFDTTPAGYEPVRRFGANADRVYRD